MMGKKIGIVSLGYAWLPCEPGPSRFYHIAKLFAEHGYEVDLIGSSFQHFEKKARDRRLIERQQYPFQNVFIEALGYKKNIDVRRVLSDRVAARRLMRHLKGQAYDLIYCSIPANNIAAKVGAYCHANGLPFVIDVEDLWPEAMRMVIQAKAVRKLVFPYFERDAEAAYRYADAVIGTSDEYTSRAFLHRKRDIPGETVYVGCDLDAFDGGVAAFSDGIRKDDGAFWVTYAGSIGASYDIRTLILAADRLRRSGRSDIKFQILGTGPLAGELSALAKSLGCENVEFLGYVKYKEMAAYLRKSDILVNSFVKGAPQSIVNKVGDYLAAGRPMVNTLESAEFMGLVERHGFGANVAAGDAGALAKAILAYEADPERRKREGRNARRLAEERFDRKQSYQRIVKVAESLMQPHLAAEVC